MHDVNQFLRVVGMRMRWGGKSVEAASAQVQVGMYFSFYILHFTVI